MRSFIGILLAVLLPVAATVVSAQPVTVTVSDPPIVMGDVESALAQITITETTPAALKDGYFTLVHDETPDNPLSFTEASTVSGSATSVVRGMSFAGPGVKIFVDADDSRIDTITVQLRAILRFDPLRNARVFLQLGEDPFMVPTGGTPTGLGVAQSLPVAIFGGYCCISIGESSTLELAVGETVTLPVVHSHPAFVDVTSFHPGIASIGAVTLNSVEITGVAPGTALIQAWNPIGAAGYLDVTVNGPTVPPQELLSLLIGEIEALVPRDLKAGQAQALTSQLKAARSSVERGNLDAASAQLHAVENLIRAHRHINPALADELLAAIAGIVEALGS